jgi:hypothetical protein
MSYRSTLDQLRVFLPNNINRLWRAKWNESANPYVIVVAM